MQAETLPMHFAEKGYSKDLLRNTLEEVAGMDRGDLLKQKPAHTDRVPSVPFITTYSMQHMNVKKLINKHWHILGNDHTLKAVLPDKPQVIYKGAPSLKDRVSPNILNPPSMKRVFFRI